MMAVELTGRQAAALARDPDVLYIEPDIMFYLHGRTYFLVLEVYGHDSSNYYKVCYDSTNPYPYGMWYVDSMAKKELDTVSKIAFEG